MTDTYKTKCILRCMNCSNVISCDDQTITEYTLILRAFGKEQGVCRRCFNRKDVRYRLGNFKIIGTKTR